MLIAADLILESYQWKHRNIVWMYINSIGMTCHWICIIDTCVCIEIKSPTYKLSIVVSNWHRPIVKPRKRTH